MKYILLPVVVFLIVVSSKAQDSIQKIKAPVRFQSLLQAGLLSGGTESAFEVQSINGIQWKTFSAGIGIGIDNYVFRTIPLFIDLRADILKKHNTPFIFTDAGIQFSWVQEGQKLSYLNTEYKSGFYFNAGAGYKITVLKRSAIVLSTAFSLKKVDEKENVYCDFVGCPGLPSQVNQYTFRRLSLKAGWAIRY